MKIRKLVNPRSPWISPQDLIRVAPGMGIFGDKDGFSLDGMGIH